VTGVNHRRIVIVGLVTVALAVGTPWTAFGSADTATQPVPVIDGPPPPGWPEPQDLDAAAYVLVEAATGQLLAGHNADERRPVASTIKILTAITVARRAAFDDEVTVGNEVLDLEGASVGLMPGDVWTVEQLLDAIIARSGNDAAESLAVHVAGSRQAFVQLMLDDAAALGVTGITLVSPSGLDDANLLSATDLAVLAGAALADADLRPLFARSRVTLPSEGDVPSRNELLETYPGATGVKTGFTIAAGNSFVGSAERGGRELIAVVLGSGDDPARFDAAAALLDLGFDVFRQVELTARLEVALAGGSTAIAVAPVTVTVPEGSDATLALSLPARPPEEDVEVPIEVDGEEVARLPGALDASAQPPPVEGAAAIGRAVVDSAYAALRAATGTGVLR